MTDDPNVDEFEVDDGHEFDEFDDELVVVETESLPPIDIDNPDIVGTAKRKYGRGAGALLAAGMFGLDKILQDKKKTESVQVQEASSDPVDVDTDGIIVAVDDSLILHSPALERKAPIGVGKKKPRR